MRWPKRGGGELEHVKENFADDLDWDVVNWGFYVASTVSNQCDS